MNKAYLLIICLLLTSFTGCLGFGDNQDKDEENVEEIIDDIEDLTNGDEKPEDTYACEINSEGYCIFTGTPHQKGLEPGTDNIIDREGNYLFGIDALVAVNSEGTILQAGGTPAFDGDQLFQSSPGHQESLSEDEKAFHKVMAIMFPIRNALMYDIESVTQDEWNELVNEFEIREIKETTFTDGQTPKDNYYGRQGIFDLAKDPNGKDIHHDVMKFLEESGLYLLCHVTSDDFAQMLADTHPEGHNPCEDAGITTKIPFEDTESNFTFEILSEHPFECMNGNVFDKFINVFGVYVVGTPGASLEYFNHTAHVTAQYIDNDEDGVADDPEVLKFLVDNNFVVPVWSEDDHEDFWDGARGTYCEDNIGMAASMYYEYDEWALGGIEEAGTWDTNLEEVWHIISVGWYQTYPEFMGVEFEGNGDVIPSNLTEAMDAARGGQFMSIPDEYPEEAWYAYYDDTCDYHCQAHEYFYWILMTNIGALDASLTDKCEDSKDEWYVCTKADLETVDVLAFDLLNNPIFNLPTNIPDGSYMDFNQNTNSPPTVSGVAITPNQASEGDILTCSYTFTDPDSDPDSSVFSWFVNGQVSEDQNSDTFSSDFVSGDSVSCSVTAYDGNEPGNTAESEAITISDD